MQNEITKKRLKLFKISSGHIELNFLHFFYKDRKLQCMSLFTENILSYFFPGGNKPSFFVDCTLPIIANNSHIYFSDRKI